jgi:hypothetical protein
MNLGELQALENNLEMWVHNIRSQKVRFMASCSSRYKWNLFKKIVAPASFDIRIFYVKQMQIMSREIEMLRNKVGSASVTLFMHLTKIYIQRRD